MKVRHITEFPGVAETLLLALGTVTKRPGLVHDLDPLQLVLPRVVVDPDQVAQYGALCGFNAAHGVPLIYPQLLTFPLVMAFVCSPDCPWSALGMVHLANHIEQLQPLRANDVLRVEMQTGELIAHNKGQGFTLDFRIWRDDELVWRATQSLLRLGAQQVGGNSYSGQLIAPMPLSHQAGFVAPADIGRRYGAFSGDRNPIHLNLVLARLLGFKRALAHGMWTSARALSCVLPFKPLEQASLDIEFKSPLYLPGEASLWTGREGRLTCFEVRDPRGERPHVCAQLRT